MPIAAVLAAAGCVHNCHRPANGACWVALVGVDAVTVKLWGAFEIVP